MPRLWHSILLKKLRQAAKIVNYIECIIVSCYYVSEK